MVHWKHDVNGNPFFSSKKSPILNTHLYVVEFLGGRNTELAANTISAYVQCDISGNEYMLLEAFIDHRKNG